MKEWWKEQLDDFLIGLGLKKRFYLKVDDILLKTINDLALAIANSGYSMADFPKIFPEYTDFTLTNDEGMRLPMPHE